ncbi:MAG: SHOCT domain-containing protein, partial [Mycobacteriaceae bacterium]
MALREELSKLDSAVAAGQITAEEFRTQRDRLLAEAGSGPAAGAPFPPPYRWDEPAAIEDRTRVVPRPAPAEDRTQVVWRPAPSAGERTQVVRGKPEPSTSPPAEDRTQVVHRPPVPRATPQPADADRTQVVRAGEGASGYANVGAPPWARGPALSPTASSPLHPEG